MEKDKVIFSVNGKKQEVSNSTDCRDSLNDFIRNYLCLKGTKVMCREGGCGVCIVNIKGRHPVTKEEISYAVNSCLVSPFSCHGKEITTIEGMGKQIVGKQIQERLAKFNGTQCGFCSPGWVANMYSALESSGNNLTMKEIENSFAGNLCRCTGYRPIADAMKSFATDISHNLQMQLNDIEDMGKLSICARTKTPCTKTCSDYDEEHDFCVLDMERDINEVIEIEFEDHKWFKVYNLDQLFDVLKSCGNKTYMLVAGNTAKGVYPLVDLPTNMIDVSDVKELRKYSSATNLEIGGGMTLAEVMNIFKSMKNDYFFYLLELWKHLDLVAHMPVRNIGTIAGNLMIKHKHNEFPSDVFVMLETIGAVITIGNQQKTTTMSLPQFLKTDMKGLIIHKVNLPPLSCEYILKTYKILPRAQNAHAFVNAGFLIKLKDEHSSMVNRATIVFGNINEHFIHASNTEKYLASKNLYDSKTIQGAIQMLSDEINPIVQPAEPSPKYRRMLAVALFYKFLLNMLPQRLIEPKYRSGGALLVRPLSSGKQVFDTNKAEYPVSEAVVKIEAKAQCSGEAEYINDIQKDPREVQATFVLSTVHRGTLKNVDATEALKLPGVVAVFTSKDILGSNNFTPSSPPFYTFKEEILVSMGGTVLYHGQPVAIVVSTDGHSLEEGKRLVKVTYKDVTAKPRLTIQEALDAPANEKRVTNDEKIKATAKGNKIKKVIRGSFQTESQYHFHMETQSCFCMPTEDGMDVFVASHWMDQIASGISQMLNVPENSINVVVRRLGGSYGGKISRATQVACACALATNKLARPVRFILPFTTNMRAIGKRHASLANYEVAVDDDGKIQYLNHTLYQNNGCSSNETITTVLTVPAFMSCYDASTWDISANSVLTDTASATFFRAPGSLEGSAMIEHIMDEIATATGNDPIKVRLANMAPTDNPMPGMMTDLIDISDYYNRLKEINEFNACNRWTKKGLDCSIMKFPLIYFTNYAAVVSVNHTDGTISVTHSGIEMGQGINTKVAQVVARTLEVPLNSVAIKPSNNFTTPNGFLSGGSITSDLCCHSAIKACEILIARMELSKSKLTDPTWIKVVEACFADGVDLHASYMYTTNNDPLQVYPIHGACVSEVEVDILTGNHIISRVDILEDVGESLSPLIDIGQVEGAFMIGVGFWTLEKIVYNPYNGELLTDRTWTYKVPGIKDIPVNFRVHFRKNAPNPFGVMRSKATGEPPLCLAFSIVLALKKALNSARADKGMDPILPFDLKLPLTAENIFLASGTDPKDFKISK